MRLRGPSDPGGKRDTRAGGGTSTTSPQLSGFTLIGSCSGAAPRRLAASRHNAVDGFVDTHSIMEAVDDFIDGNGSEH